MEIFGARVNPLNLGNVCRVSVQLDILPRRKKIPYWASRYTSRDIRCDIPCTGQDRFRPQAIHVVGHPRGLGL